MYAELVGDRQCKKCAKIKPLTSFSAHHWTCKVCRSLHECARQAAQRRSAEGMKWCAACNVQHSVAEFNRNRTRKDGLMSVCRQVQAAEQRAYDARNRPEVRALRLLTTTPMPVFVTGNLTWRIAA